MNSQKRFLLTVQYLWDMTDEEHPLALKDVGEYLRQNGIESTRKTLQADIKLLTEFGMGILAKENVIGADCAAE